MVRDADSFPTPHVCFIAERACVPLGAKALLQVAFPTITLTMYNLLSCAIIPLNLFCLVFSLIVYFT